MSIWAQIGDQRVVSVPPDGRTPIDVYADFSFSNTSIPEGTQVTFLIGRGGLPSLGGEDSLVAPEWTVDLVVSGIIPIDGIQLVSEAGDRGFECVGIVQNRTVRASDGTLQVLPVAKCSVTPVADPLVDEFTIIAYSDFDKTGTVSRLQPQEMSLTVMSGNGVFLSIVERYDPSLNAWELIEPMPTGRAGLFAQPSGGKIYAIGGFNGAFTTANEEYDPGTDSWTERTPLPVGRGYGASVVDGGYIYIIGGYNFDFGRASTRVDRYDPIGDSWVQMASLPIPLSHAVAEVVGSDIYVMYGASAFEDNGGTNEKPTTLNFGVYKYSIGSDEWSILDTDTSAVAGFPVASAILAVDAAVGDTEIYILGGEDFFPNGSGIVDRGGAGEETFVYTAFDAANKILALAAPLTVAHVAGDIVDMTSIPESRVAANSVVDGTVISVFNGMSFSGFSGRAASAINGSISTFDTATGVFTQTATEPSLSRLRAADAFLSVSGDDRFYVVGGSADKSDFLNELEIYDVSSGTFTDLYEGGPDELAEMSYSRHSLAVVAEDGMIYALGGGGSGHPPGWLKIEVTATPDRLRADGKQTAGILIEATDDSGDPPDDGTDFLVQGIISVRLTSDEIPDGEPRTTAGVPAQKTSILPVIFSAKNLSMIDGQAATILLARSEDPIKEVENLFQFTKNGEQVPTEEALKSALGNPFRHQVQSVGGSKELYVVNVEVSVQDDFYFGRTDTDGAIFGTASEDLSSSDGGFDFNPPTAQQGLSAQVDFFSDITSIPDVQLLTEAPVDADDAKVAIGTLEDEIPFGASPHYDALSLGVQARNVVPSIAPPQNLMVSVSDNDESFSASTPQDVVDEANAVAGRLGFPIFVTTFIVTDPISLAARRARTDVADLEFMSFETGGNSFSIVDPSYLDFVIQRIKTSAPSSIGSGRILATRDLVGTLLSARFDVEGVPGNEGAVVGAATNSAEMRLWTSDDGYNFTSLDVAIPPNTSFALSPVRAKYVRYEVLLESPTFDSPILQSVSLNFVRDNVQYIFTAPQTVSGQISELAATVNHRLPTGGTVEVGFFHGDSIMFDRDYKSTAQPPVDERGTIMAVNRSFDTFVGEDLDESTRDRLDTDDLLVYRSRSGPWSQEAVARVFLNNAEVLPADFVSYPEEGVVAFRKRTAPGDLVELEVQNPSTFRVGVKIVNPALQTARFDEFAYMFGGTEEGGGIRLNRPPRATNLFMSSPLVPGGPVVANYTFSDPDGDEEDEEQTEINWFRDGALVPELRGLKTFSDSDLIARRADAGPKGLISKGQEWFFTVRPSDGRAFGPLAVSHKAIVSNLPPVISNQRLESSNSDPTLFTSSDSVVAKFKYQDPDDDASSGTIYTWFVNGIEVKSGSGNSISPTETDAAGNKMLRPGNTVRAVIVPSDGEEFGTGEETDVITIQGTPPEVNDVSIIPAAPTSSSTLNLSYRLVDVDAGTDQSAIAWFKNDVRVSTLDNSLSVSGFLTAPGQNWYAIVTPNNGFEGGESVKSNVVVIQF